MSNEKTEKVFADGFILKRNENAPGFVVGGLSIKVEEAVVFLEKHSKNGWVNLSMMQSKSGKYYCELDTFEPQAKIATPDPVEDDLPF